MSLRQNFSETSLLDWLVLLPILFLPSGALVIALLSPRVKRARAWLPILLLVLEIGAVLVNIAPFSHRIEISNWEPANFVIAFQAEGIALLLLLLIFVPFLALQLFDLGRESLDLFGIFVITAAILLICAANLITIYFAWALLDFSLFARRQSREETRASAVRALIVSQLAGLALFAGALSVSADKQNTGAWLIALAFWARLGLFPFHWALPTTDLAFDLWTIRAVPLMAGLSLWLRWETWSVETPAELISAFAVAALIAALIWIWRESEPRRVVGVSAAHAVALVPLAMAFGGDAALAFALWMALGIALALAMFEASLRWRAGNENRWRRLTWLAGLVALAGLTLTPASLGRVGLYVSIWEAGQWPLLLIAATVTLLVLAPLWNFGFALEGDERREPTRVEYAALELLGLVFVALTFAPTLIARVLGASASDSADRAMDRVIRTNDALGVGIGFVALIAPIILSLLGRARRGPHSRLEALAERAARLIDLAWLARWITNVGYAMGAAVRNLSALAEENATVWILLVALWIAIFILIPR